LNINNLITYQKIVISLFFIVGLCFNLQSQTQSRALLDSLKNIYEQSDNDTLKLKALTRFARRYRYINIDSSKYFLRKSIQEYKDKNINNANRAFPYNVIANIYKLEPNIDSARYYYEEAYGTFQNSSNTLALLAIIPPYGEFLISTNEAEKGIKMFQDGIELAERNNEYANLSYLFLYLGNVYSDVQKDNDRARDFYRKGLEASQLMAKDISYDRVIAYINLGLSDIYLDEEKIDSSIICAERTVESGSYTKLYQEVVSAYNNITKAHISLGQFIEAKAYNLKALALNRKVKNFYATLNSKILTQKILLSIGDYANCIEEGNLLLSTKDENLSNTMKANIYGNICDCYIETGDLERVSMAKDSLLFYTNEVLKTEHNELLALAYNKYQNKEQKIENRLLKAKHKADAEQLRIQRFAAIGLIAALILAVFLIIVVFKSNLQEKKYNEKLEEIVGVRTKELQEANANLIQSNRELKTLSYIASHDIKEPIKNIGTFAGLIQHKLSKWERNELKTEFQIIQNSTKQLYTLIEDFTSYISFSKMSELPIQEVDLNTIIQDIKTNLLVLDQNINGEINAENLPIIQSNKSAIYIILKNLIDNGLRYNNSTQPTVNISINRTPSALEIVVEDNGIGIAPEYHEEIFKMFKRLHNRGMYKGSGIGLSIVELLTKKLQYEISIKDAPHDGSQFVLSLTGIGAETKATTFGSALSAK